ncbi:hypothetical protein GCM10009682_57410 [Luedemannella flava]|uniref:Uncharacterized protein n=1 Tax=Luedemannella flava TaxID=349316 RepID=A0ABP4YV23_9ACTN
MDLSVRAAEDDQMRFRFWRLIWVTLAISITVATLGIWELTT